ncbi:MAG: YceD family protein [Janthinobacterium lividum]
MKKDPQFDLPIARLSLKTHHFAFELGRAFFEQFDPRGEFIADGNLHADVALTKTERVITLSFHIVGTVRLTCDRSLDEYDQPLDIDRQLLVRYGDEPKELDDDVLQVTPETLVLDVAQHLYDYIGLALPMKRLHPRFQHEADEDPEAETKLIFSTRPQGESPDDDEPADPRWAALKNLN